MAYLKINTVTNANIKKVDSVAKANIGKINSATAPSSWANAYSVGKSITTGASNYIRTTIPADSPINLYKLMLLLFLSGLKLVGVLT